MLCENCKKNNATTYFKQNINGNVQEIYLCSECAAKLGIGNMSSSLFDFLLPQFSIEPETERSCGCGTTFGEISRTGMVGCPDCYTTFRNELSSALKKIHGVKQHVGRIPERLSKENAKADKKVKISENDSTDELKARLDTAIKEENFEEAAKLRDMIKAKKGENGNGR